MKTKNRLLLTSAMMLALVAVSGTTATYAWWISSLSGKANLSAVNAAADASLKVSFEGVHNCEVEGETITASGKLTDVTSKDGKTFQKAALDSVGNITDLKTALIGTPYATGIYYAIEFKATISMESLAAGLTYNVYLGDEANKMIDDSTNEKAVRMAVSNGSTQYVLGNESTGNYQSSKTDKTAIGETNYKNLNSTSVTEVTSATAAESFGITNLCLGNLTSTSNTLTINFTMWFEGAITNKEPVDSNDTFSAHLYVYAVRVAA